MDTVTVINALLLALLVFGVIAGLSKGLIRQVIELLGMIGSFLLAALFSGWLAGVLHEHAGMPYSPALVIAFLGIFIAGLIGFHFVGKIVHNLVHMTFLGWVDRFCGAALGLIIAMLVSSALIAAVLEMPVPNDIRRSIERSEVSNYLRPMAPALFDAVFSHGGRGIAHSEIFRRGGAI